MTMIKSNAYIQKTVLLDKSSQSTESNALLMKFFMKISTWIILFK